MNVTGRQNGCKVGSFLDFGEKLASFDLEVAACEEKGNKDDISINEMVSLVYLSVKNCL